MGYVGHLHSPSGDGQRPTPASALRLTAASPVNQSGRVEYAIPQPTADGLDIRFTMAQWGGPLNVPPRTADGLAFFLPKPSEASNAAGYVGGSLGYAPRPSGAHVGLAGALVGAGFDQWGGFTDTDVDGTDCAGLGQAGPGDQANTIGIRSPGTGTTGYCYLGRTTAGVVQFGNATGASHAGRARTVRITVDSATQVHPKTTVYYDETASATPTQVLQVVAPAALLAEPTDRFGFSAGTGTNTQNNAVWDLQVSNVLPSPAIGSPVTPPPGATVADSAAPGVTWVRAEGSRSVVRVRARSVPVRLAATMVSSCASRTTSYTTMTLRRARPLPGAGEGRSASARAVYTGRSQQHARPRLNTSPSRGADRESAQGATP